jgi:hypothetical protein
MGEMQDEGRVFFVGRSRVGAAGLVGAEYFHLYTILGTVLPYLALLVFMSGFVFRVVKWGKTPVPFRIPTTCGQQRSLPGFKPMRLKTLPTSGGLSSE